MTIYRFNTLAKKNTYRAHVNTLNEIKDVLFKEMSIIKDREDNLSKSCSDQVYIALANFESAIIHDLIEIIDDIRNGCTADTLTEDFIMLFIDKIFQIQKVESTIVGKVQLYLGGDAKIKLRDLVDYIDHSMSTVYHPIDVFIDNYNLKRSERNAPYKASELIKQLGAMEEGENNAV